MKHENKVLDLLKYTVCPSCKGKLDIINDELLQCKQCSATYKICNHIPYLLTEESQNHLNRFWEAGVKHKKIHEKKADKINFFKKIWKKIPEPTTPIFSVNRRIKAIHQTWKLSAKDIKNPKTLIVGTFLPVRRKKSDLFHSVEKAYKNSIRLDIIEKQDTSIIADGHVMPFPDGLFDIVIAQATIKHLRNPYVFVEEVNRILKPNGFFYCEVAYLLAYHKWPGDYVRFTPLGIKELLIKFNIIASSFTRGPGYTIAELLSIYSAALFSFNYKPLYSFLLKVFSWLFLPVKYLDCFMLKNQWSDYIGQVNYCIAQKK
jgi:SAM-dependent methyltransferase/uncharacterized protein YbaR (Trm112 family)